MVFPTIYSLGSGSPSSGSPSGYLAKLPPGILPPGMPEVKVRLQISLRLSQSVAKEEKLHGIALPNAAQLYFKVNLLRA